MPRLSLFGSGERGTDYQFFDKLVSEQFIIGATTMNVHKYLGVQDQGDTDDLSQPSGNDTELAIQDMLFGENRDRKYEPDVYELWGHYSPQDSDMEQDQFAMLLQNDNLYMTFHLNDMVERIGRKLMISDVLELPHLKDYYALNDDTPVALKRFYVVDDASRAAEGYSPTWQAHLWKVKVKPMVDSQEYSQILDQIEEGTSSSTIRDLLSTYNKEIANNQAVIDQAEAEVPESGYDTSQFYIMNIDADNNPGEPEDYTGTDSTAGTADTPQGNGWTTGYLTADGAPPPNGHPVSSGTAFPVSPNEGEYALRLDYLPNRLFRYNGTRWVKIEIVQRTDQTPGAGETQMDTFVNNTATTIGDDNTVINQKVDLYKALKPTEDN